MKFERTEPALVVQGALRGTRALVFGAGGGIGRAVATAFREIGAEVTGVDLQEDPPDVSRCDVTSADDVSRAFEVTISSEAPVHVVAAHGVADVADLAELSESEWRRCVEVNLHGAFLVTREAARSLSAGSTLTLLGSQAGLHGAEGWSAYAATKFGVVGLAQSAAQELAAKGVRVNVVCPGNVQTKMTDRLHAILADRRDQTVEQVRTDYERAIPMRRFADPAEISSVCLFLASEMASYVTGATIVVDGGELS